MAIKTFKEIIDNNGYRISSNDRKIFEQGNLQSFFGFGDKDVIEFIIYDLNDNQLPQINDELVRYIPLTTSNINDYFLIAEGTLLQKHNFPKEYFIDIERLLRESGYDNGIFKTQITLINNRVGGSGLYDTLWISEISPSRTEIRLFPLKKGLETNDELQERFNLFVRNGEFRDDTINLAFNFIEKLSPASIDSFIKQKYSAKWFDKLKAEFKITNFQELSTKIYNKFIESCFYEFTHRVSDINSNEYGKPKKVKPAVKLSKEDIRDICKRILISSITYYLSKPDVVTQTTFDSGVDASLDEVGVVLQRLQSNTVIDTSNPVVTAARLIKPKQTNADLKLQEEIRKQIPEMPIDPLPPIIVTPIDIPDYIPPEPPVIIEEPRPVYKCFDYSYSGYSGGTIYWTDCGGMQQSMYVNPGQTYIIGCARDGSLSGFGPFVPIGPCGSAETPIDDIQAPYIKQPEPIQQIGGGGGYTGGGSGGGGGAREVYDSFLNESGIRGNDIVDRNRQMEFE